MTSGIKIQGQKLSQVKTLEASALLTFVTVEISRDVDPFTSHNHNFAPYTGERKIQGHIYSEINLDGTLQKTAQFFYVNLTYDLKPTVHG